MKLTKEICLNSWTRVRLIMINLFIDLAETLGAIGESAATTGNTVSMVLMAVNLSL